MSKRKEREHEFVAQLIEARFEIRHQRELIKQLKNQIIEMEKERGTR